MLLGISISYSLLISKLDICGSGKISKNSWNIYFENINIKEGSVNGNIDSITETGLKFDILLNKPGDYFVFSVDVVNGGSFDAMVENVGETCRMVKECGYFKSEDTNFMIGDAVAVSVRPEDMRFSLEPVPGFSI